MTARADATEGLEIARATGQDNMACYHLAVLAGIAASFNGAEETATRAAGCHQLAAAGRIARVDHIVSIALAEASLAAGEYELALERLTSVLETGTGAADQIMRHHAVPSLVEAGARAGHPETGQAALDNYQRWTEATGSAPNRALVARCQALLADDAASERLFEEALRLHATAGRPFDRGHTELLYGESLRRRRRRLEAREHLRAALDLFDRVDAQPWATRAATELRASGETARRRQPTTRETLTPQEVQVARAIAEGATSKQVAGNLFLSPRTIDAHLRNIYTKLGLSSRRELATIGVANEPAEPPHQRPF
jgi:DNA-binding CsgD family transcriptional regulator